MSTPDPLLNTALRFYAAGLVPIPVKTDGSKAPMVAWQHYQRTRPPISDVINWFRHMGSEGIGTLTGHVAGDMEMLEFEGRALSSGLLERYHELLDGQDMSLWTRLQGWAEFTPGGGVHFNIRVSDGPARRNTKLACTGDEIPLVLIETRGEGGFTVNAPSGGRTHPSGRSWTTMSGGPASMGLFSSIERDILHSMATLLDQRAPREGEPAGSGTGSGHGGGRSVRLGNELLPGDDFNATASWSQILEPQGWTAVPARGFTGWVRPGKDTPGISASTGVNDGDNLYVFSSSTPFTPETPYSKFAAYTLFEHAGNYGAAASALRAQGYGKAAGAVATPHSVPTPRHLAPVPDLPLDPDAPPPEPGPARRFYLPFETSMAQMLIDTYADVLRYCPQRKKWLTWADYRWIWDEADYVWQHVITLAEGLSDGAGWVQFKKRALSATGIRAVVAIAATLPAAIVHISELDAHPYELNTPGGIINLRTGVLGPSDPAKLHTRSTSCTPDFEADPSVWLNFLSETFGADTERIAFIARLMGYTANGVVSEHILPFCQGGGGNGKGVFLETCMKVLGDYATSAPSGFLVKQFFAKHETEIARLAGVRMVLCSEVNEEDTFDEAKVKQLTGGDQLTGRFMRGDFFSFTACHTMWLMANNLPAVHNGGRAFWRRMRLLLFQHDVINEIRNLQSILAGTHGPAVLAWMVGGGLDYLEHGLAEPASVIVATKEYESDQDTVARFVGDEITVGGGELVTLTVAVVRRAYEQWCQLNAEHPVSAKRLSMEMVKHGAVTVRTMSARLYANVSLRQVPGGENWRIGGLS